MKIDLGYMMITVLVGRPDLQGFHKQTLELLGEEIDLIFLFSFSIYI